MKDDIVIADIKRGCHARGRATNGIRPKAGSDFSGYTVFYTPVITSSPVHAVFLTPVRWWQERAIRRGEEDRRSSTCRGQQNETEEDRRSSTCRGQQNETEEDRRSSTCRGQQNETEEDRRSSTCRGQQNETEEDRRSSTQVPGRRRNDAGCRTDVNFDQ